MCAYPARVLVFPCGTEIALEIHRALASSAHVELYGASSIPSNHGRMVFRRYIEGIPFVHDPACIAALNALIERHQIDLIYPAHDDVVTALTGHPELLCPVMGASRETAEICRSKRSTYARLKGHVATPVVYDPAGDYPLPVFLKPEAGQGSHGVMLARTRAQVDAMRERDPSLLLLEYLPGAEFTIDCFSDASGQLRFSGPRERLRTMNGISVHTRPLRYPELDAMAKVIAAELPQRGAWFFQVKHNAAGEPVLLEVAPRVSGGMGIFRALGVNLPLLSVYDALGQPVHVEPQDFTVDMDRALRACFHLGITYKHVYIDFDDTIIRGGRLNPLAVAFLAQCRNAKVQTHLLSRHDGDLESALTQAGLLGLFDTVTHIQDGAPKSGHVRELEAIFVDDSFAERQEVRAARRIPVFAVDALEALIDWSE
jgi:hypothetical protein